MDNKPITEQDMQYVQSIFQRAIDGIVGMSQLNEDVKNLRAEVGTLQNDLARTRRANEAMEESLASGRQQRQDLERKLAEEHTEKVNLMSRVGQAEQQAKSASDAVDSLTHRLADAAKERDDAQLRVMELEDQVKEIAGKWNKVRAAMGMTDEPKAPLPPPSTGQVVQEATTPPAPLPEPDRQEDIPEKTRKYIEDWQPGAIWDVERQSYYVNEALT